MDASRTQARMRTALAAALTASLLGGCAVGQRLGWTSTRTEATAQVQASCTDATQTLKGGPDHATALDACVAAKTRQHLRN